MLFVPNTLLFDGDKACIFLYPGQGLVIGLVKPF